MIKLIKSVKNNQILKTTSLFFVGSTLVNFGAFLYHLILARMLGPIEYGTLAALSGLTYFVSVPMNALDILITKVVSSFEPASMESHTKFMLIKLLKKYFRSGLVLIPVLILITNPVKNFLHLPDSAGVVSIWIVFFLSILAIIFRSALKGLLLLKPLILNQIFEMYFRLLIAIVLITALGTSYFFGQVATVISLFISVLMLYPVLSRVFASAPADSSHHGVSIKSLGVGSLIISAAFTWMYSIDVVLVKHFFSSHLAGIYAVLATSGKIVFFAEAPLGSAIIPLVARKSKIPHTARGDLLMLMSLISLISLGVSTAYFVAPNFVVNTIYTSKFSEVVPLLGWMGITMYFYSIANACANFLLALGHIKILWLNIIALISEIILIVIFHTDLNQVIFSLMSVFGILALILSIACYQKTNK